MSNLKQKRGIAILYAVLLTTIILTIGLILADIITKQIVLSSIGKNSQTAYYAATLGKECALYWDLQGKFGSILNTGNDKTFESGSLNSIDSDLGIKCGGYTTRSDDTLKLEVNEKLELEFQIQPDANSCAVVQVYKDPTIEPIGDTFPFCRNNVCSNAVIISSGYNVSCDVVKTAPHRAVERSLWIQI